MATSKRTKSGATSPTAPAPTAGKTKRATKADAPAAKAAKVEIALEEDAKKGVFQVAVTGAKKPIKATRMLTKIIRHVTFGVLKLSG